MLFTNSRSIIINNNIKTNIMPMKNRQPTTSQLKTTQPTPILSQPQLQKPKMKWGAPTWYFLHTLVAKIKPEYFSELKEELIKIIISICNNVPCPICAEHSTQYTSKTNFNSIQTQHDLQMYLFKFHNDVNTRKNVPLFTYDELIEKYSKSHIINIYNNFVFHFQDKHHSIHMIANDMFRTRILSNIKKWFSVNISKFDI
jgi:hypothetical protein